MYQDSVKKDPPKNVCKFKFNPVWVLKSSFCFVGYVVGMWSLNKLWHLDFFCSFWCLLQSRHVDLLWISSYTHFKCNKSCWAWNICRDILQICTNHNLKYWTRKYIYTNTHERYGDTVVQQSQYTMPLKWYRMVGYESHKHSKYNIS